MDELARVESRVRAVENSIPALQREMHAGFSSVNMGFSQIKEALAKLDARPTGGMREFMGYIRDFAITIGLIVTGIVYVAGAQWSTPIALVTSRVNDLGKTERGHRSAILRRLDAMDARINSFTTTKGNRLDRER